MRKVQKGFTLVELIVVITILAILATIAFISLQGYSQDARNSKVNSDLRTLATALETRLTEGLTLSDVVGTAVAANTVVDGTATFGTVTTGTVVVISATNYDVGNFDFVQLRQNGNDFTDDAGNAYLVAYAASGNTAYYQVAGQTTNADGSFTAVIRGNYIDEGGTNDADGLVSPNGAATQLTDGAPMADTSSDLY